MAELLLSGTTTTTDHRYVLPGRLEDAIDIEVEEAKALGLRVLLTRGSMSLSRDDGGLLPRLSSAAIVSAPHRSGARLLTSAPPILMGSLSVGLMLSTAGIEINVMFGPDDLETISVPEYIHGGQDQRNKIVAFSDVQLTISKRRL